jgi:alpha/beta superfamily hydrolase
MTTETKNPDKFPTGEATFLLSSPTGQLEMLTSAPAQSAKPITVIICHPHPLFSGTMHNKVVYTLARTFKELGLPTVRFNFRGVGASTGEYAEGIGETEDLLTVLQWIKQVEPTHTIWLAGFSFGSFVASRAARLWPTEHLILIAPPVKNFHFDFAFNQLPALQCPSLVVQGEQDEVVSPQAVYDWVAHSQDHPKLLRISDSGHFFHGKLIELKQLLISELQPYL